MTYNIRVGAGREKLLTPVRHLRSSRRKLEAIASPIECIDPDVIALQEVRSLEQAKLLADALNLNYAYISHGNPRFNWGLAILSKFSIIAYRGKLIHSDEKNPRKGLLCAIDINNKRINVINVHYRLGAYEEQVEKTMELLAGAAGPVILMGDFNLADWDHELASIRTRLIDSCAAVDTRGAKEVNQKGTFRFTSRRLDYIFVDPAEFVVRDVGLTPREHRGASDHIAYFACVIPKYGRTQ